MRQFRNFGRRHQGGWAWIAPIAAAAISALSAKGQQDTSAKSAQERMAFEERMSNTAHQREVGDLRAAGLNPILSGTGGAGSSTPAGAQYQGVDIGGAAVSSAVAAARAQSELKLQREQAGNQRAQAAATTENIWTQKSQQTAAQASAQMMFDQAQLYRQQLNTEKWRTGQAMHEESILANAAKGARIEGEIDEGKVGEWSRVLRRLIPGFNSAAGAARSLR